METPLSKMQWLGFAGVIPISGDLKNVQLCLKTYSLMCI